MFVCACVSRLNVVRVCAEDSDDEDDSSDSYGHAVGGDVGGADGHGLSYLAVSLEVESGLISMLPEVRVQGSLVW